MAFCVKCGNQLPEGATFCTACGEKLYEAKVEQFLDTQDNTASFEAQEIAANTGMACLAYVGPLWLIPFFMKAKSSKYVHFHLGQALNILVLSVVFGFLNQIITNIVEGGGAKWIIWACFSLPQIVFSVIGIINALSGKAKTLPVLGKFDIFK